MAGWDRRKIPPVEGIIPQVIPPVESEIPPVIPSVEGKIPPVEDVDSVKTSQIQNAGILFLLDEEYIVMLQTGNGCDVYRTEDFTDVEDPPYGKHVFRPMMGYKAGLLVTRYLLRHSKELYKR